MSFIKKIPQVKHVPDSPDDEGELFGQIVSTLLTHFTDWIIIYNDDA